MFVESPVALEAPASPLIRIESDASIEIVLKIQETCNINCKYCYMYNVGNELYKELPTQASEETFQRVGELIVHEFKIRKPREARVILHGGEPMMMRPSVFSGRMRALRDVLEKGLESTELSKVQFALQTNATLVSDAWIDQLTTWNIRVGVSIDGLAASHDARRVDKRGRGTYDRVRTGIEALAAAHRAGRIERLGALCVIDPQGDGAATYKHLVHELGFTSVDFLLPFMNWDLFDESEVNGVGRFLASAFCAWHDDLHARKGAAVRIFGRALSSLARSLGSEASETLDLRHYVLVVESDGTIMPEESLRPTYSGRFAERSIHADLPEAVFNDPRFSSTLQASRKSAEECSGCALLGACGSGYALGRVGMRFSSGQGFARKSVYCSAFVDLYVEAAAMLRRQGKDWTFMRGLSERSEFGEA